MERGVAVDGPLAGQVIEVDDPLRRLVTVSLGSTRIRRVYGKLAVDVDRHHGLATYLRTEEGWKHVQTPLAIGDGVDIVKEATDGPRGRLHEPPADT